MDEITRILDGVEHGDPKAAEELLPLVYEELRRLAAHKMANEAPGQTLQPTALVHDAWLRLVGSDNQRWDSRGHFFSAAAEAMRRILIDNARRKQALRHGGGQQRVDISEIEAAGDAEDEKLTALDEALHKLVVRDAQAAELVKLRYFAGLTIEEAAQALGISVATANRLWAYARAWLYTEMRAQSGS